MAQQWLAILAALTASCGDRTPTPATMDSTPVAKAFETSLERQSSPVSHGSLIAVTTDNVEVHGYIRPSTARNSDLPVVLLFHQGGANAQGEYGEIQNWLAFEGISSIAWDTRSGGDLFGATNRTVLGLAEGTPNTFCDALPDVLAAIDTAAANGFGENGFILWGSSYTGALVFHAAAERAALARGVIAFSPASGAPMEDCRAIERAADVQTEMLVLQPAEEVIRELAAEQRLLLEALGASYVIVQGGAHGSSLLLDDRTGNDMKVERKRVLDWLKRR